MEQAEFLRSRLTRDAVRRQVLTISDTAANLAPEARALLPEIDWDGWTGAARSLSAGGTDESEALWFAVRSLVSATLMWLRVYRNNQPALFSFTL